MPIQYIDSPQNIGQNSQQTQNNTKIEYLDNQPQEQDSKLPGYVEDRLNVGDNLRMSFADEDGKNQILQSKYKYVVNSPDGKKLVGDDPTDLQPYEPNPITEDPVGFLARHVSDINQIAQSAALEGLTGGAAAPFQVLAAGAGLATGGITNKLIGKSQGVNQAKNMAEDAFIDTAFGSAFAGASRLIPHAFESGRQKAFNILHDVIKAEPDPAKRGMFTNMTSKFLSLTSGVPQEKIAYLIANPELAAKDMGTVEHLGRVASDIHNQVESIEKPAKAAVRTEFQKLKSNVSGGINTANLQNDFIRIMRDNGTISLGTTPVGFNDAAYIVNEDALKGEGGADARRILNNYREISNNSIKTVKNGKDTYKIISIDPEAKISLERLGRIQDEFSDEVDSRYAQEKFKTARQYKLLANGGDVDVVHQGYDPSKPQSVRVGGIKQTILDAAEQANQPEFSKAMSNLSQFNEVKDRLLQAGLNFSNPTKVESSIRTAIEGSPSMKAALASVDTTLGTKFGKMIQDYDVARSFQSDRVNLFRIGTIMSLIGMGGIREIGGLGAIPKLGAGITLGSPKGVAGMVRNFSSLKSGGSKIINSQSVATGNRLLRTLLAQQSSKVIKSNR